ADKRFRTSFERGPSETSRNFISEPEQQRPGEQKQCRQPAPRGRSGDLAFELSGEQRNRCRKHSNRAKQVDTSPSFPEARNHDERQQPKQDPRSKRERFLVRKSSGIESRVGSRPASEFLRHT